MRKLIAVLALVVALGSCSGGDDDGAAPEPSPSSSFPIATVLLDNGEESTLVTVEVAETPEQHQKGLSGRQSLPDDEGMVFVFFDEQETGLQIDDTPIPVSIAYFDARGTIVRILEAPAEDPGQPYLGALVVNQGMFAEWDISEGDHVQLTR